MIHPGEDDESLKNDNKTVSLNNNRASYDSTNTTVEMYFNECIYQLVVDIENKV